MPIAEAWKQAAKDWRRDAWMLAVLCGEVEARWRAEYEKRQEAEARATEAEALTQELVSILHVQWGTMHDIWCGCITDAVPCAYPLPALFDRPLVVRLMEGRDGDR